MADSNVNYEEEVDSACTSPSDEKQLSPQVVSDDESSNPDMTTLKSQRAGDIKGLKGKSLENVKKEEARLSPFDEEISALEDMGNVPEALKAKDPKIPKVKAPKEAKDSKAPEAKDPKVALPTAPIVKSMSEIALHPQRAGDINSSKGKSLKNVKEEEAGWSPFDKEKSVRVMGPPTLPPRRAGSKGKSVEKDESRWSTEEEEATDDEDRYGVHANIDYLCDVVSSVESFKIIQEGIFIQPGLPVVPVVQHPPAPPPPDVLNNN